jgi:hypothetical protein
MSVIGIIDDFLPFRLSNISLLTGFAKLLLTTNFKFEKTSNGSSAKKINTNAVDILHRSVFLNRPDSRSCFKLKTWRCKMKPTAYVMRITTY